MRYGFLYLDISGPTTSTQMVVPGQVPQLKCQEPDCVQEIYSLSSYQYHVKATYKIFLYLFRTGIMYKYDLVYKTIGIILSESSFVIITKC